MIGFERVVAPFDGVVIARRVNIGDYVTSAGGDASAIGSATPLFRVADVSKLRIFVAVPQNMGAVLKPGIKATLTLPDEPGKPISADSNGPEKGARGADAGELVPYKKGRPFRDHSERPCARLSWRTVAGII